ncbi:glycogen/starch/alpha-glucan family phosphorylase [Aerococcaceae bacterium NML191292]|nr:glycogen/starch/alpha-glucan family phosphorylase [Aerococcaceae bacterium NML191292]
MNILGNYVTTHFNKSLNECTEQELYKALLDIVRERSRELPTHNDKKKLYYFSAEFLIGKLLSNNLLNLGIYDTINAELQAAGKNIMDIEQAENEPSLGNGGLGRLAACFVDSIATLGINGDGVGLNYHFGLFRQVFKDNQQTAIPDPWLTGDDWTIKNEKSYSVPFKKFTLTSTLYDIDVLGYQQDKRNRLRLFDLDTVTPNIIEEGITFDKHNIEENLTLFLYPDDSDHAGELLRIYQQYFMVSNGAQLIIDEAIAKGSNLHDLADYAVIQINDTHPALVIPEMIRLLGERGIEFDEAVDIVQSMTAFTNHTILAEALEKWPVADLEEVIPNIMAILRNLDARKKAQFPNNSQVTIIDDQGRVHMAHLSIHYGYSVNGVAALHTDILKSSELKAFYDIYPEKFNNKTNGITFRRWIMDANPELAAYLDELIGTNWHKDSDLTSLAAFANDSQVKERLSEIKRNNKLKLKKHLQDTMDVTVNENSIFDIQIKRMHEYKRQQMNALYVIHKYLDIKAGNIPATPITVMFGGKAAPAYTIAQDVIHLILTLSELIAKDPAVSPHLQVVMVENYNVSHAQYLIPACDISEQISLASKEASGTGNMKFMLNGALTLGTMDGANVEIHGLVGDDNIYIFGKESDEIIKLYETKGYVSRDYYETEAIQPLVDFIVSEEMLALGNEERLSRLHNELIVKDWFMTLIDLVEYIAVKEQMLADYENQSDWVTKAIHNIAQAGFFSSDRTIAQYNEDIWHLAENRK